MIYQEISMNQPGSMPGAKLVLYVQDYSNDLMIEERPFVLVCPGGGYGHTSDREAETLALQFMAMGCHAGVLRYSIAPAAHYPTALLEITASMKLIRDHVEEWHIDPNKILVQGCSAGAHLAASLGMFWNQEFLLSMAGIEDSSTIKPNGMILCYPVITSGEYAHRGSFDNLLEGHEELLEKMSLETQVTEDTPRAFIWHTFEDQAVPLENSLFLVGALRKKNIPTEYHVYPKGCHGLGLANELTATRDGRCIQEECTTWINLARTWIENFT